MKMKRLFNKMTESPTFWGIVVGLMFAFLFLHWVDTKAQNITRKGNIFYQDTTNTIKKDEITFSGYYYVTKDGQKHPVFVSSNGKCFIFRTSKNGKRYRQYIPKITEALCKQTNSQKM